MTHANDSAMLPNHLWECPREPEHDPSTHWARLDGRIVPIKQMSNSHLLNTIAMLERRHKSIILNSSRPAWSPQGDMAQIAFDQAMDALIPSSPDDTSDHYPYLVLEAEARGIRDPFCEQP